MYRSRDMINWKLHTLLSKNGTKFALIILYTMCHNPKSLAAIFRIKYSACIVLWDIKKLDNEAELSKSDYSFRDNEAELSNCFNINHIKKTEFFTWFLFKIITF
jgi:hypothetical protein